MARAAENHSAALAKIRRSAYNNEEKFARTRRFFMSIALLQEKIRARKTPLALVLGPEADKLPARTPQSVFVDKWLF